jgi:D-alanyl-D-alanine carboxypeptidase
MRHLPIPKSFITKLFDKARGRILNLLLPINHFIEKNVRRIPAPPAVTSKAVCVMNRYSGDIVMEKNANIRLCPASLVKLATSLLLIREVNTPDSKKEIVVVKSDLFGGSTCGALLGESLSRKDLLYAMMLPSGNDAAKISARIIGNDFQSKMQLLCKELGLRNTNFITPHGSDTLGQYSTAYELAKLSKAAFNEPALLKTGSTIEYDLNGRRLTSTVEVLGESGILAGKTGTTPKARGCLSVVWNQYIIIILGSFIELNKGKIVPGSDQRYMDVRKIIHELSKLS